MISLNTLVSRRDINYLGIAELTGRWLWVAVLARDAVDLELEEVLTCAFQIGAEATVSTLLCG